MIKKITPSYKKIYLSVIFLIYSLFSFSQTIISTETFNSILGIWTAGGSNVTRSTTTTYEGSNSVRFKTGTNQTLTIDALSLINASTYNKIDVKFFVKHTGVSSGKTILLQYRTSTSASWQTIRTYTIGTSVTPKDINSTSYHALYGTLFSSDFGGAFSSTSQFQFVTNISSSSQFIYIDNVSIIGTTYNTITTGPGGITANLETWLRADKIDGVGAILDNTNVNKWEDIGKGNDASVIDDASPTLIRRPKYKNNSTNNINFNPVVYFDNDPTTEGNLDYTGLSNRSELNATGGFSSYEQYIVVMNDNPAIVNSNPVSIDLFCAQSTTTQPYDKDGTGFGFGGLFSVRFDNEVISYCQGSTSTNGTAEPVASRGYGINQNGTGINHSTIGILSSRNNVTANGNELYLNANRIDNQEVGVPQFVNFTNRRYWLGRSQVFNGSFGGRIAEVITYTTRKNDISERRRIESYLALKYGITLGVNGTTMNYEDSIGAIVWNSTTNAGYNYDVAGIFRDDASQHSQKQSKSINTNDDITIGLTDIAITNTANTNTFDTDKKYLVWGNNRGTLAAQPAVVVNMSIGITPALTSNVDFVSVGRTWKVVETGGNVATTKVSIPTTMLSATLTPPGDYLMFISNSPVFNPTAEYRIMKVNGSNLETSYDFDGTKFITFGFAPERTFVRCISFDGIDDYLDAGKVLDLNTSFTVSAWIKRSGTNQTILSKRNGAFTTGYDLGINGSGNVAMRWMNGSMQTLTSSVSIPAGKWHNVAVIYDSTLPTDKAKLFIDGVKDTSANLTIPSANSESFLIAAADGITPTSFFNGTIDEVRIWDIALSDKQLRYVMNQEISRNATLTGGTIIPNMITLNEIGSVLWTNLSAYYPMSTYTFTNAKDVSNNNYTAALKNLTTVDNQTAPLPYESNANGAWNTPGTWLNNDVQDLPNSLSIVNPPIPIDWNIVQTTHDITSGARDITVLGLKNNAGKLTIDGLTNIATGTGTGQGLRVTHYLELDGSIDLEGESQLIQDEGSILDADSGGDLERDQQGTANSFNYNYWTSSVGPKALTGTSTRGTGLPSVNAAFTIDGALKDGRTTASPAGIVYNPSAYAADAGSSGVLTVSSYWLYQFYGKDDDYYSWFPRITQSSNLAPGVGYTMKGSLGKVPIANQQNYVFKGKPYNGDVTLPLVKGTGYIPANSSGDVDRLIGNPYPSALDATKFILDNLSVADGGTNTFNNFNGALYFWDHFGQIDTHILREYVGRLCHA